MRNLALLTVAGRLTREERRALHNMRQALMGRRKLAAWNPALERVTDGDERLWRRAL